MSDPIPAPDTTNFPTPTAPTLAPTTTPATAPAGEPASAASLPPPGAAEPATAPAAIAPAGVPERYDLALDGMTLDPQLLHSADPVLRELGLSNDQAGKLLPLAQGVMQRTQDALLAHFADAAAAQKRAWAEEFAADPEIGGGRRAESEHLAARGLDALGFGEGHPFRQALADSGFGNHPDMIRAFRRLGQLLSEDSGFARAHAGSANQRPVWERLYPQEAN
ncbi:hypothetical protein [Novosphingobium capsulatum]|uniref:hypothetical protein n=1 Tax=Novosphingobium capsulatum TaxID=13688 RepID=UPI002E1632C5|nr:hypothetical protein U0041_03580 [Novosphingobium capsulatum]